jgi:four helix bundle protein
MLEIYPVILAFVTDVASLTPRIAHHDPDLARQLRRASSSVALNCAEGMYARGRSRTACFNTSLREMRECYAALEVSVLLRYLPPLDAAFEDRIQRILGTLYRLSFPRHVAVRKRA